MAENSKKIEAYLQEIKEQAQGTFWDYVGCMWEEAGEGPVTVSVDIKPHHMNLIGILHGGVHATLMDSAMGLAAMLARPNENLVTTNLNLHYVSPVEKGRLTVTAEILHGSRKMMTAQAFARNAAGELCAHGTGTFRVIGGRNPKDGVSY